MESHEQHGHSGNTIHLPAPTAWPIVLAFGATLIFAGLVTHAVISILGAVLLITACVGWFRQVLPHEAHEDVSVEEHEVTIESERTHVTRIEIKEEHRAHLPLETYPVLSGLKGGIAGGIAMLVPALLYGIIGFHSIWYPVNLLGGAGVAHWTNPTTAEIATFHPMALIIAIIIHASASILVGLLYGAMLPMLPRHPILLGGIIAPLLWTGLLHATLGIINPAFDERIQWGWFLTSQITYGLVAGWVVAHQSRIHTSQSMPFVVRMGLEASGLHPHSEEGEDHRQ